MDFSLSDEHAALRSSARDWLARHLPADRVARHADAGPGLDEQSWSDIGRLGWLDPDAGVLDLAVLAEEAGAALYPGPWLTTVALARPALQGRQGDQEGSPAGRPATLAWAEDGVTSLADPADVACRAVDGADGLRLSGVKTWAPDAAAVDTAVVLARDPRGPGLFAVDVRRHPDVVEPLDTLDATRPLARLRLSATPARRLTGPDETPAVLAAARRRVLALLAAEAVGVARRALEFGVDHARTREQFGRPIGAYQGVAHPLADAWSHLEVARTLAHRAAWSLDAGAEDAERAVTEATVLSRRCAVRACEVAIQVLGGTGFTWEHQAHRLYRRALWIQAFDGPPAAQRARLAALVLTTGTG
jgi:alkylation response protein AidB-like acyl-CoA dehydrogenase